MKNHEIKVLTLAEFTTNYDYFTATAKRFLALKFRKCCHADIEEFVSDALLDIFEVLKTRDIPLTCRATSFIASIARNKAIDGLRKRKKMVYFDSFSTNIAEITPLSMEREKQALRHAIDKLPLEKQAFIEKKFRALGDNVLKAMSLDAINAHENCPRMTFEEIAEEQGIQAGTLRQTFKRLKPELKKAIQKIA